MPPCKDGREVRSRSGLASLIQGEKGEERNTLVEEHENAPQFGVARN